MQHPRLLSFVITAYNYEAVVSEAIRSALDQRLTVPFEVVVVDDYSDDKTWQVVSRFAASDRRVRALRNERNLGGGASRNLGIKAAAGDVIHILDADDILPLGMAQRKLDVLVDSDMHAVSVETVRYFHETPKKTVDSWNLAHSGYRSGLREFFSTIRSPSSSAGHLLFTRTLFDDIGGFEEQMGAMDAWTFGLKQLVQGYDFAIAPGTFYFHRVGHNSFWIREENLGTNDRAAVRALKMSVPKLPHELSRKVIALDEGDPLFSLLEKGYFVSKQSLSVGANKRLIRRFKRVLAIRTAARRWVARIPGTKKLIRAIRALRERN